MPETETPRSEKPNLFALGPDGGSLHFWFARCGACGRLNFPQNAPGCHVCGEALSSAERVSKAGGGTLLEAITIQVPLAQGMKTPLTIGRIRLAEGIVEEGVLEMPGETVPAPGLPLRAVACLSADGQTYGCVFTLAAEGAL